MVVKLFSNSACLILCAPNPAVVTFHINKALKANNKGKNNTVNAMCGVYLRPFENIEKRSFKSLYGEKVEEEKAKNNEEKKLNRVIMVSPPLSEQI